MAVLDKKSNQIAINFNKKFYDGKIIRDCLRGFSEVCKGKLSFNGDFFTVILEIKDTELTGEIAGEFGNYVLAMMKNKTIV